MFSGWGLDCFLGGIRGGDGLESVDWEGVEKFVGYYEGYLVLVWRGVRGHVRKVLGSNSPEGTKRIFSVQIIGKFAYLLIL